MTVTLSRPLEVYPFYCPMPETSHPQADELDARSVQWMMDFGICDRDSWLAKINSGRVAALMIPHSEGAHLDLFSDCCYWAYAWDDAIDGRPDLRSAEALAAHCVRLEQILDLTETAIDDENPLCRSLGDLCRRITALPDQRQQVRLIEGFRRYIRGAHHWTTLYRRREVPDLNQYLLARSDDCAGSWMVPFYPVIGGYQLTDQEVSAPLVRAIGDLAPLIGALDNDIVSYHREATMGEFNILDVLRNTHGCSLQQAVSDTIALRDRLMCLYLRIRDHLVRTASPELGRFASELGYIVRGHMEWAQETLRYLTPQHAETGVIADAPRMGVDWVNDPSDNSPEPPPLPGIAWWWEHLSAAEANTP